MKRVIEIRPAEGGDDSKLFVQELADAYVRLADRFGWKRNTTYVNAEIHIEVSGTDRIELLEYEAGGHRIQRIPPNERRGRVHTSTVTVAIIDPTKETFVLNEKDLKVEWFSGSGAGGQHRNKHQNSCRLLHIPTGTLVTSQTRSRKNSYNEALDLLEKKLYSKSEVDANLIQSKIRKDQVGSGMRGDKIRTYRFQDDRVVDHRTGKKTTCSMIERGHFDLLW